MRPFRIRGLFIISIAKFLYRFVPFKSNLVSFYFFKFFRSGKPAIVCSRGYNMIVIPGITSCWRNVVAGREFAVESFLRNLIPKATGFLDCGAHMGYFSCLAAGLNKKMKVLAVEPLPECFRYLTALSRINNFKNIEIVKGVLSERDKMTGFVTSGHFDESGKVARTSQDATVMAQGYSLNTLLQRFGADDKVIVKVDIEGYEPIALNIVLTQENKKKIIALYIEIHLCFFLQPWPEFWSLLQAVRNWFAADWFIAKPRCLQNPFMRYWNRATQQEPLIILNTDLVKSLIDKRMIAELGLFGIKNLNFNI